MVVLHSQEMFGQQEIDLLFITELVTKVRSKLIQSVKVRPSHTPPTPAWGQRSSPQLDPESRLL